MVEAAERPLRRQENTGHSLFPRHANSLRRPSGSRHSCCPNLTAGYFCRTAPLARPEVRRGQLLLATETQAMSQGLQEVTGIPFIYLPQPVNPALLGVGTSLSRGGNPDGQLRPRAARERKRHSAVRHCAPPAERPQTRVRFTLQWLDDFPDEHGRWIARTQRL